MAPFTETIQQFGEQIQRIGEVMTVAVKEFRRGGQARGRIPWTTCRDAADGAAVG